MKNDDNQPGLFSISLVLLAMVVQLWVLFYILDPSIYFYKYWELALRLRGILPPPLEAFYSSPFYTCFLAAGRWVGGGFLEVLIIQAMLGGLNCWLIYRAGIVFFNRPVGCIASLAAIFYGPFLLYNASCLPAVWVVTFNLASLVCLGNAARGKSPTWLIGAGLCIGLSIITRPNVVIFLAALLIAVIFLPHRVLKSASVPYSTGHNHKEQSDSPRLTMVRLMRGGYRLILTSCILIPALLVVLPVSLFNYRRSGEFIPVTTSGGWVFYCGNNQRVKGFDFSPPPDMSSRVISYYARPGGIKLSYLEHLLSREMASEISGRRLSHRESSAFWFGEGMRFIRETPGAYLKLLGKKLMAVFNGYEPHDVPEVMLDASRLKVLPLLGLPVLLPLALLGLIIVRPRRGGMVLYLYLAAYLVSFLIIYVIPRYRLPVVPVLLLFGAAAVREMYHRIRERAWPVLIRNVLLLIPLAVLVNISTPEIRRDREITRPAFRYEWEGLTLMKRGGQAGARKAFLKALELNPDSFRARRGLELLNEQKEY